jgi:hypothetical protein
MHFKLKSINRGPFFLNKRQDLVTTSFSNKIRSILYIEDELDDLQLLYRLNIIHLAYSAEVEYLVDKGLAQILAAIRLKFNFNVSFLINKL